MEASGGGKGERNEEGEGEEQAYKAPVPSIETLVVLLVANAKKEIPRSVVFVFDFIISILIITSIVIITIITPPLSLSRVHETRVSFSAAR